MMISNLLPPATKKAYDKKASTIPSATPVTCISELVSFINNTSKRHVKLFSCSGAYLPREMGEYINIGASIKGNEFCIFDNASNTAPLTFSADSVRAYHENDVSISIYTHDNNFVVLRSVS